MRNTIRIHSVVFVIVILLFVPRAAAAQGTDLGKRYAATLDRGADAIPYTWSCDKSDVWSLASFVYDMGKDFKLKTGPAQLVVGHNGTNALMAVLIADPPGTIQSSHPGDGERASRIYMRFHPSLIGKLFPVSTVKAGASELSVVYAKWVIMNKINSGWQYEGFPVIPTKGSFTIDIDTVEGTRRVYDIDLDHKTVGYITPFEKQILPKIPTAALSKDQGVELLDKTWRTFDEQYAMFGVKPKVDWDKIKNKYKSAAAAAKTNFEIAGVIAEMTGELEDLHVWVSCDDVPLAGYNRPRMRNASYKGTEALIGNIEDTKKEIAFGKTDDGIGYISIFSLGNKELTSVFDDALDKLHETWGLILDLRFNGGGDELLARQLAGRFLDTKKAYNKNQYRSGPRRVDLGPKLVRECEPRGPWRYSAPVVVLLGQRTMSSAESLACMLAQCPQAVTMGDRTAGSSANPKRLELPLNIVVNVPQWLDLDMNEKSIDAVGVKPQMPVACAISDFTDKKDVVTSAALAHLRKIEAGKRQPGKK
ncbi:MAG: hypothetical protein HY286_16730 [Planctomycetes bacterium]|nr:hypothetical protein [Planctomycetota bacterium]